MENYIIGFSTGMLLGLAVALPGPNDVTVSLNNNEVRALQRGHLTQEFQRNLCKRYEEQLAAKGDIENEDIGLCLHKQPTAQSVVLDR